MLVPLGVSPCHWSWLQLAPMPPSFVQDLYTAVVIGYAARRTQSTLGVPARLLLDRYTNIGPPIATGSVSSWLPSTTYETLVGPHTICTVWNVFKDTPLSSVRVSAPAL